MSDEKRKAVAIGAALAIIIILILLWQRATVEIRTHDFGIGDIGYGGVSGGGINLTLPGRGEFEAYGSCGCGCSPSLGKIENKATYESNAVKRIGATGIQTLVNYVKEKRIWAVVQG